MTASTAPTRYSRGSIAMHWLMLVLMAAVYALIEFRGIAERGSDLREGMKWLHFSLGLSIFLLVWVRLALRWRGGTPPIVPAPPRWQSALAHAGHGLLYLLMLVMPILGWAILSAEGHPVSLFGLPLPALVGKSGSLAEQLEDWHKLIGTIGYWLIGLHAAAALLHHYLLRDNTVRRMLPG